MSYKEIGRVTSASLEIEDHGLLTCWVQIDFGGASQGFGGYMLDERHPALSQELPRRRGTAHGLDWVLRLLQLFRVSTLDAIRGRAVFAVYDQKPVGSAGNIIGLELPAFDGGGSFLVSDWRKAWDLRPRPGDRRGEVEPMTATIEYRLARIAHPWPSSAVEGTKNVWAVVKITTPELGNITEEAIAVFNRDSEAETFAGHVATFASKSCATCAEEGWAPEDCEDKKPSLRAGPCITLSGDAWTRVNLWKRYGVEPEGKKCRSKGEAPR